MNADNGGKQTQSFDGYTAGNCGASGTRVQMSQYVEPTSTCAPSAYGTLTITEPTTFSSGTVAFQDAAGNPIPGIADQTVSPNTPLDLSALPFDFTQPLPQMLIRLTGATDQPITAKVTWTAPDDSSCTANGQIKSSSAGVGPTVTSVGPNTDLTTGGKAITLHGTGFQAGAIVTIGGKACTNVVVVSSTLLTCNDPSNAAGSYDLVVTNPDTQSATLTQSFTYGKSSLATTGMPLGRYLEIGVLLLAAGFLLRRRFTHS
jgi:hypothetical protein